MFRTIISLFTDKKKYPLKRIFVLPLYGLKCAISELQSFNYVILLRNTLHRVVLNANVIITQTRLKLSVRTAKSGTKYLLRFNSSSLFYMISFLLCEFYLGKGFELFQGKSS